jgi:glycosyltransferase involved in cell wall biosynthesis
MEAMSYGIPVIATDSGGTKELVDGQSGILVKQNDPNAILSGIIDLINKPDFRRKISKNGRNKIMQDFDTMKNANDLIKLF